MNRHSCIYEGRLRHRRFAPAAHAFEYRLFMMYVDLTEGPGLFEGRWLWSWERFNVATFRRADHFGEPGRPLADCVRQLVRQESGRSAEGPIRLLTHLRYGGYCFNPVSFFYCFDPAGERVESVVGEVSNTPWGERHCYVLHEGLDRGRGASKRYEFSKAFHVSPFMAMEQEYTWRFTRPGRTLAVHMDNRQDGGRLFDATLLLRRRELGAAALARVLARYPLMTARVMGAIHWQAFRLWLKRCPVHPHPKGSAERGEHAAPGSVGRN